MMDHPDACIVALFSPTANGGILRSPTVGIWRFPPPGGRPLAPGMSMGELEQLGRRFTLLVPEGARGVVVRRDDPRRILGVEYGQVLVVLEALEDAHSIETEGDQTSHPDRLQFRTALSGRFYDRPSPEAAPFVKPGGQIQTGQTVALLEIMKTFHRVTYGGPNLPTEAVIVAVIPRNGDDVAAGDPLLELSLPPTP